jgi:hypothetical protein
MSFPIIQYGRRIDKTGKNDFYDVLSKSADFPADAEMLFRQRLCKSIEWSTDVNADKNNDGTVTPYTDCFLFWKLSAAQILVAKLTDAGCDLCGRPHSIGIEAVLIGIDSVNPPVAKFLARFIQKADWAVGTMPEEQDEYLYEEVIKQYIENKNAESLLLASHIRFYSQGISIISTPECTEIIRQEPSTYCPNPALPSVQEFSKPRRWSGLLLCITSIGILFLGTSIFLAKKVDNLQIELLNTQSESRTLQIKLQEAETKFGELQTSADRLKKENLLIQKKLEQSQRELYSAERELEDIRMNADAALNEKNISLERENTRYKDTINAILKLLDEE